MSETVFEPTDHPHRRYNPLIGPMGFSLATSC